MLEKRHRKYFLRFSYTEEVPLTKTPVKEQIICSVDLGLNTDAVCTIMRADGTVLGRKFIDFPSEKDRMYRVLGRISRFQRKHGSAQVKSRWAYDNTTITKNLYINPALMLNASDSGEDIKKPFITPFEPQEAYEFLKEFHEKYVLKKGDTVRFGRGIQGGGNPPGRGGDSLSDRIYAGKFCGL